MDTLEVEINRVLNIYFKLKKGRSISEEEKKKLPFYLGIKKVYDEKDMIEKIQEFFSRLKKRFEQIEAGGSQDPPASRY